MTKFAQWTNEKLTAQSVFPRLDINSYLENIEYADEIKHLVNIGCGGFCIFQGNIKNVKNVISELQMLAEIPLLFCADFENGLSMRLEDGTSFPHSMALGKTGNFTADVAKAIAKEAKELGVFWNLAPVCDINSNPKNPVINIRSFGAEKNIVEKNALLYINATQSENIISCAKHFPGHGDTETDSHSSFPVLNKTLNELENNELTPFVAAINANVKSIMIGHLIVEKLENNNENFKNNEYSDKQIPASLSKAIVTDLLRKKLNYQGLTVTDGLDMKSITNKFDSKEIAEFGLNAGIDVFLIPENPKEVIKEIKKIIEANNEIRNNLVESVKRIYDLKVWTKLIPRFTKLDGTVKSFNEHSKLALRAALEATECIIENPNNSNNQNNSENFENSNNETEKLNNSKNPNNEIEKLIQIPENKNYAAFSIIQKNEDIQAASRFFTMLAGATENDCDYAYLDENIEDDELKNMKSGIIFAEFIIFALFFRGRGYSDSLGSAKKLNKIIDFLADNRKYIVIFFGDPYLAKEIKNETKILTFSDSFASLAAAVMKLTGRQLPDEY